MLDGFLATACSLGFATLRISRQIRGPDCFSYTVIAIVKPVTKFKAVICRFSFQKFWDELVYALY